MALLEELTPGAMVKGILPDGLITVIQAKWHGSNVVELTYKDSSGSPRCELLYRDREPILEIASAGLPWSFDADGKLFRLVSEARRIRMAYLFDPLLAVNTSLVDPLPHQITAVYGEMLTRQPLRFLLADDPGAGKTIMAGLLIKELLVRANLVAAETRVGEVYNLLLRKLEEENLALGDKVFNILGKVTFENKSLRELLIKAIRKGESPEARAWLNQVVDKALWISSSSLL